MHRIDVAVIGAGQAGLALSRWLTKDGIEHMVFERREIGARWITHAWDSLRLLTPNWMNGLPGSPYAGREPDGFMQRNEFLAQLRSYAESFSAPVLAGAEVHSVAVERGRFRLATTRGVWIARAVVLATGQCDRPHIPEAARVLSTSVLNLHSSAYRNPASVPDGRVLVIGASASGVQIADELTRQGRDVSLAVGRHTRLPRTWRGHDIFWWMNRMGILAERTRDMTDPEAARRQPLAQLAGRPDRSDVDLRTLQQQGVSLVGRFAGAEPGRINFADDLTENVACAEARQGRLLARIDAYAGTSVEAGHDIELVDLARSPKRSLSVRNDRIGTIIWATGYRTDFSWVGAHVVRSDGQLIHRDGVTPLPGLFALGFRLLRKRDSHFIGGVGTDARAIADEISVFLDNRARSAA
jgi:putative flavoprotein involved in K+ transport